MEKFWFLSIEDQTQRIEEINNELIQKGYLTFQDLKKKTGIKIKDIQNLLYPLSIAKQMGNRYLSSIYFPIYVPFEKLPKEIDDDLYTKGYCEGKYCTVVLKKVAKDFSGFTRINSVNLFFVSKVEEALLKEKKISSELEETDLDLGFDSGDPFEDLT